MKFISPLRFISALFSVACLSAPQVHADVTYRLVTHNDMLIDRCVYLMVAEDIDIAATNEWSSPTGIKTTAITREGDIIKHPVDDNVGEFILRYTGKCDPECFGPSAHADFNWGFQIKLIDKATPYMAFDFNKQGLVRDGAPATIGTTYNKKQYRIYHYISKLSVAENNTLESAYYADSNPCGQLFMEETQDGYVLNVSNNEDSSNKRHNIKLYRKDVFGIKVTEITKDANGSFRIKLHFNTYDKEHPNYAGFLFYAFSDEERMSNDDIYDGSSEQRINRHSDEELEITYTGNKKYLWLVKEHTLNNSIETDVIKVEIKETPLPVTSAEAGHFTHPAAEGYAVGNYIDFEPKDSDVKIYYTLDGRDPIIPGSTPDALSDSSDETEDHTGKTYDLDERPLIYEGSPLSVRYVAVKAGHEPSAVGTISIPGIPTAIDIIGKDDTPAKTIYYNMQGLRVCQPLSPGLYIRRQGCKTEKIIVR